MENKQTAVEWFWKWQMNNPLANFKDAVDAYKQAKQMEKKQIVDAANLPKDKRWYNAEKYNNCGEQYYNETYKTN